MYEYINARNTFTYFIAEMFKTNTIETFSQIYREKKSTNYKVV
jgi:hypothetical protein